MSRLDRRHTADRPVREIGNSMLPLYQPLQWLTVTRKLIRVRRPWQRRHGQAGNDLQ